MGGQGREGRPMRDAARQPDEEPAPPSGPDLDAMAARVLAARLAQIERQDAAVAAVSAQPGGDGAAALLRQLILETVTAGLHDEELRGELAGYAARRFDERGTFAAGVACGEARAAARPKPPGPRHAAPSRLTLLKGGGLKGAGLTGALFPLRHIAAAVQHGAASAAASSVPWTATAAAGTALAASLTLAPAPASPAHAGTRHAAASAARPSTGTRAVPVVPPSSPAPAAVPDAARARKAGRHRAPPSPPPVPPSPPSASLPPSPAPPPSPPPPPVAPGTLVLSSPAISTGPLRTAQITLTAEGGPVTWSAGTDSQSVTLDVSGGHLLPGQSAVIEVTITDAPGMGGSAVIDVGPGGQSVTVSWTGLAG